jgi:hypothetical protein
MVAGMSEPRTVHTLTLLSTGLLAGADRELVAT